MASISAGMWVKDDKGDKHLKKMREIKKLFSPFTFMEVNIIYLLIQCRKHTHKPENTGSSQLNYYVKSIDTTNMSSSVVLGASLKP